MPPSHRPCGYMLSYSVVQSIAQSMLRAFSKASRHNTLIRKRISTKASPLAIATSMSEPQQISANKQYEGGCRGSILLSHLHALMSRLQSTIQA